MDGLLAYSYYSSKKIDRTLIFMLFLIFISGLFIFLCPGNYQRLIVETNMWWPTFNSLNLFNKLNMGISSFYRLFISGNTIICLLFFLSFGAYNYIISKKDKIIGLITTIPFIIAIIINFILLFGFIPKLNNFFNSPASYNLVSTPLSLFFSFLYLIMTLSILYGIFNILKIKGRKTAFLILLLLSIGFITSIITGFTPTMFISMSRMLIFLYACLYIITYYMITQIIHSQDKSQFYKSKF